MLKQSLPTLLGQKYQGGYEITVVDSRSTDGAKKYDKSLSVKLVSINPDTFNFAGAFNPGAKSAKGKYLIRLSGDVIPIGKNWLTEMTTPFKNSKVGGTYGRYTITGRKGYRYPGFRAAERFPKKTHQTLRQANPFYGC